MTVTSKFRREPHPFVRRHAQRIILAAMSLLLVVPGAEGAGKDSRILVLAESTRNNPFVAAIEQSLHAALVERLGADLDYSTEYIATSVSEKEYRIALRELLRRKYAHQPLDVVIALGTVSLTFARDHGREAFPDARIVTLVTKDAGAEILTAWLGPQPATGLVGALDFKGTLDLILRLQPATREVVLIAGPSASDTRIEARARGDLSGFESRVKLRHMSLSQTAALTEFSRFRADTAIVFLQPVTLGADVIRSAADEAWSQLGAAAGVPVYSVSGSHLGRGIVGGSVMVPETVGQELAELALRSLKVAPTGVMPVRSATSVVPVVNWHQLRRWDISESRLSRGTQVLFRDPSVWELHRWSIITGASISLQTLFIGWLMLEHRRRRRAECEVVERLQEARTQLVTITHLDRRAAMGEVTAAITHELNQPLEAILHNAEAGEMILESGTPSMEEMRHIFADIRRIDMRAAEMIQRLRGLLKRQELETHAIDVNELARETAALVGPVASSKGVRVDLDLTTVAAPIAGDWIHLQQVLLNMLLNAMEAMSETPRANRHLTVRTLRYDDHVQIAVKDAGHGIRGEHVSRIFEPFFTTKGEGMGIGLSISRTIVEAHGGRVAAQNNAEGGATVWFTLPVTEAPDDELLHSINSGHPSPARSAVQLPVTMTLEPRRTF